MRYKKYIVLTSLLILLVVFPVTALANPSKNPNFPTFETVQQMITDVLTPLTEALNNLVNRLNQTEQGLNNLELQIPPLSDSISQLQTSNATTTAQIADLNGRVNTLEGGSENPEPPAKPYYISSTEWLSGAHDWCPSGAKCFTLQFCGPVIIKAKATLPSGEVVTPTPEVSKRQLFNSCGPTNFILPMLNSGDPININYEVWWGEEYYTESETYNAP